MDTVMVTEPTFFPMKPNGKGFIGIASVVYNNALALNSISVYLRPDGSLRLLFPIKTLPNSKELNVFYPINQECYEAIRKAVSDKYEEIASAVS